ncbi:hypothetical protein ACO0RG_002092 [Hanseniaspora osmophila]
MDINSDGRLELVLTNKENLLNKLYKDQTLINNYKAALLNEYPIDDDGKQENSQYDPNDDERVIEDRFDVPSLKQIRTTITILLQDMCILSEKCLSHDDPDFSLNLDLQSFSSILREVKLKEQEFQTLQENERPKLLNLDELSTPASNTLSIEESLPPNFITKEKLRLDNIEEMLNSYLTLYSESFNQNSSPDELDLISRVKMLSSIDQHIKHNVVTLQAKIKSIQNIQTTLIDKELLSVKEIYQNSIISSYENKIAQHRRYLNDLISKNFQSFTEQLQFLNVEELFAYIKKLLDIKISALKDYINKEKTIANNVADNLATWQLFLKKIDTFEMELLSCLSNNEKSTSKLTKAAPSSTDQKIKQLFDEHIDFIETEIVQVCKKEKLNIIQYVEQELRFIKLTRQSL